MGEMAKARRIVDTIVKEMVAAGYPVEATNKADHRPDHLPVEMYAWRDPRYHTENLARLLVGGWFSKGALIHLVMILLDRLILAQRISEIDNYITREDAKGTH